jgi:hypothetical protein
MTDIQARIDNVMELDKARTPGKYIATPYGIRLDDESCYTDNPMAEMYFMAAAPDMISIIKELTERLEMGFAYNSKGERIDCKDMPDGISCRNATIAELQAQLDIYKTLKAALEARVSRRDAIIAELRKENFDLVFFSHHAMGNQ